MRHGGEELGGDIGRSEDHLWERGNARAHHVLQSADRDGTPDAKGASGA